MTIRGGMSIKKLMILEDKQYYYRESQNRSIYFYVSKKGSNRKKQFNTRDFIQVLLSLKLGEEK